MLGVEHMLVPWRFGASLARTHARILSRSAPIHVSVQPLRASRKQRWRRGAVERRLACRHQELQQRPPLLVTGGYHGQLRLSKATAALLSEPQLPLRHGTAGRTARSDALFVGSTSSAGARVHSRGRKVAPLCRQLAKRWPALWPCA